MKRQAFHRKNQAAPYILKRQDIDADHRTVECENVKYEDGREDVERPGPALRARRDRVRHHRIRDGRYCDRASDRRRHRVSSLRMSTVRRISATNNVTTIVSTTALAAAEGYCRTPTSS